MRTIVTFQDNATHDKLFSFLRCDLLFNIPRKDEFVFIPPDQRVRIVERVTHEYREGHNDIVHYITLSLSEFPA